MNESDGLSLAELENMAVLVVDDNATNRRIFEKTLEKWNMRPTLVDNGPDAIVAVRESAERGDPFKLVLLDANMPGMDGFTAAKLLKGEKGAKAPTIMMLTSSGELMDSIRCRDLNISSYLVKPVRQTALVRGDPRHPRPHRVERGQACVGRTGTRARVADSAG